ncbi:22142_t:CDS:2, partial [Dentiscutata erythropus]
MKIIVLHGTTLRLKRQKKSKHRIDKDHPDGINTDGPIVKAMHIITKCQQEKLAQKQISDHSQFIADEEDSFESDIEYEFEAPKPPITSMELHNLVKAASYFSLQKYWNVFNEIGLIALFLNLRIKNLKFIDDVNIRITTISTVRRLCSEEEYHQPLIEEISRDDSFAESSSLISNDLMADLYSNEELDSVSEESE